MSYQNDREAYILANTYAFCPPQIIAPVAERELDYGKYEPDEAPEEEERWMGLAQTLDATWIMTVYRPAQLIG